MGWRRSESRWLMWWSCCWCSVRVMVEAIIGSLALSDAPCVHHFCTLQSALCTLQSYRPTRPPGSESIDGRPQVVDLPAGSLRWLCSSVACVQWQQPHPQRNWRWTAASSRNVAT